MENKLAIIGHGKPETSKQFTVQDKNFTVRLKAAAEKRLKEVGIITGGSFPPHEWASKEIKQLWQFIESLDTITVNYLQGEVKDKL